MKQIYIFLVCLFASIGMNAQEVKLELEWVNSLEDAEKCYDDIKSFWYKDVVMQEDVRNSIFAFYSLGRRLGMFNMDMGQKYNTWSEVKVKNEDEVSYFNILLDRIAFSYTCLQKLLVPMGESVKFICWSNFETEFHLQRGIVNFLYVGNTACIEYRTKGITFSVLNNFDEHFAYDITVYNKKRIYNKKSKKYYYKTYEKRITVMPKSYYFISSSISIEKFYFSPTSYTITNKYYVGKSY